MRGGEKITCWGHACGKCRSGKLSYHHKRWKDLRRKLSARQCICSRCPADAHRRCGEYTEINKILFGRLDKVVRSDD